jgi:hypothetical protein
MCKIVCNVNDIVNEREKEKNDNNVRAKVESLCGKNEANEEIDKYLKHCERPKKK